MPEISRFLGIVITMFYNDHGPPHFHATYGDHAITISIRDENVTGELDRKSTRLNSSHDQISYAVFCLKKKITRRVLPPTRQKRGGTSTRPPWRHSGRRRQQAPCEARAADPTPTPHSFSPSPRSRSPPS